MSHVKRSVILIEESEDIDGSHCAVAQVEDEEDTTKITEREVEDRVYDAEQEYIHVDCEDDGESHCSKTHVDDDYKVRCEFVKFNLLMSTCMLEYPTIEWMKIVFMLTLMNNS